MSQPRRGAPVWAPEYTNECYKIIRIFRGILIKYEKNKIKNKKYKKDLEETKCLNQKN